MPRVFLDPDHPDERPSLLISDNLARVFEMSARLCSDRKSDVSYSSALLCFSVAPDELSLRFRNFCETVDLREIARFGKFDLAEVQKLAAVQIDLPSESKRTLGVNFLYVFNQAKSFAAEMAAGVIGVRHVMAAFIADFDRQRQKQLENWKLKRQNWMEWFLQQMQALRPGEVERWASLLKSRQSIRSKTRDSAAILKQRLTNPSFLSDRWTTVDKLGYSQYAYALYRFLVHPLTEVPLTVSIQAPWGGGKTSLMKLVRSYMDRQGEIIDSDVAVARAEPDAQIGLKVGEVLAILRKVAAGVEEPCTLIPPQGEAHGARTTIWFNPWKYENSEQVWCGLAECIISSISRRLTRLERERFWIRLNLSRINIDGFRTQVHNAILEGAANTYKRWLNAIIPTLLLGIAAAVYLWRVDHTFAVGTGILSGLFPFACAELNSRLAERKAEKEPATGLFKDLIQIPDYNINSGLVHNISKDLGEVFKIVGNEPIVIFIDDLDRCSPRAIAEVFEGLNRFVSGDFLNCIFVMGIDDAVIASALKSTYDKPSKEESASMDVSLGWRFMDKFVQVPFALPEPTPEALKGFKESLAEGDTRKDLSVIFSRAISEFPPSISEQERLMRLRLFASGNKLSDSETADLEKEFRQRRDTDQRFDHFQSTTASMCQFLEHSLPAFMKNPRDLKRFLNAAKFSYFVGKSPSVPILMSNVVLATKWPQVTRFLRDSTISNLVDTAGANVESRMDKLRQTAVEAQTFAQWNALLRQTCKIPPEAKWPDDADLYLFLRSDLVHGGTAKSAASA